MPHIDFPQVAPGLIGPLRRYPETATPLAALALIRPVLAH